MLTDLEVLKLAASYALGHPMPVCAGCPSGQFEDECSRWTSQFAGLLRSMTGISWSWSQPFPGRYAIQLPTREEERIVVVAEVVPGKFGARTLQLVPVPPVDPPDRIAEILEKLTHLQKMVASRDANIGTMIQRCTLLVNHYGRAAYELKIGPFKLRIERQPDPLAANVLPSYRVPPPAPAPQPDGAAIMREWGRRMDPEGKVAGVVEAFDKHTREQVITDAMRDLERPADQSIKVDPRD